jgi:hypothetical protein
MSNGESEPRTEPVNTPPEVTSGEPPEPMPEPASFEEEEAIQEAMETAEAVQDVVAGANLPPGFPKPSDLKK